MRLAAVIAALVGGDPYRAALELVHGEVPASLLARIGDESHHESQHRGTDAS